MTDTATTPSNARKVTLFEDRAEVVRTSTVTVGAGNQRVRISGVTLLVDDRSLQVRIQGDTRADVLAAKVVRRRVPHLDDDAQALDQNLQDAKMAQRAAKKTLARVKARLARAQSLLDTWIDGVARVPGMDPEARQQWSAAAGDVMAAGAQASGRAAQAAWDASQSREAVQLAQRRLDAARQVSNEYVADVEVQLEVAEAGALELELTYRTPAALWRPEHLLRLVETEDGHEVLWTTMATAWQITGEDWSGVQVEYSTARPASAANAPRLRDDVLRTRRKSDEERKQVHVESRDMSVETARAHGAGAAEMMGVDDGGTPVLLQAPAPVSLPSTGQPHRVKVGEQTVPVTLRRVLYPELGAVAHFAANGVLPAGPSMLAGPAHIARGGTFVGRTRVDFTAAGEPFELGFGPDDGVRVRRKLKTERERTAVLGTQTITRRVYVFVSNLSDEPRDIHVVERVPVSEIDAVKVRVTYGEDWAWNEKDGFLSRDLSLEGRQTVELELAWEVRAGSDVVLPF